MADSGPGVTNSGPTTTWIRDKMSPEDTEDLMNRSPVLRHDLFTSKYCLSIMREGCRKLAVENRGLAVENWRLYDHYLDRIDVLVNDNEDLRNQQTQSETIIDDLDTTIDDLNIKHQETANSLSKAVENLQAATEIREKAEKDNETKVTALNDRIKNLQRDLETAAIQGQTEKLQSPDVALKTELRKLEPGHISGTKCLFMIFLIISALSSRVKLSDVVNESIECLHDITLMYSADPNISVMAGLLRRNIFIAPKNSFHAYNITSAKYSE
jgi:hypothetical protein